MKSDKYKYALDNVLGANYSGDYPQESEMLLQELVDKATPMKVLNREQHSKDSDAYGDCPICKTPLCDYTNPKGCGGCLQAIDWSGEE